jgi:hypothetical protein
VEPMMLTVWLGSLLDGIDLWQYRALAAIR